MTKRPLHYVWIADCSGSLRTDGKIQSLNIAINEALPAMREVAESCPNAEVLVSTVEFSNGARWRSEAPMPVSRFVWDDLVADGFTDMGEALTLVAAALRTSLMGEHALPPVLVLLSDGQATDDHEQGLRALLAQPWGRRAFRVAIAIGSDADLGLLRAFTGDAGQVIRANNPTALGQAIRWAATAALTSVAAPLTQSSETVWGDGLNQGGSGPGYGSVTDVW